MFSQISNGLVSIRVNHKGAELVSLYNHALQLEYMWQADPTFWPKSSPILFPVVGALKEGSFFYDNKAFTLPRHGFAREMEFELESNELNKLVFVLRSDDASRKSYPFDFILRVRYEIDQFEVKISYEVANRGSEEMLFSIGAHPAFKVPLIPGTAYSDYFLKFEKPENSSRWLISKEGLIETSSTPLLTDTDTLPLRKELFYEDALVFKDLKSSLISIRSHKHTHGLDFTFPGFPFFGIWAFKDADFVCLEPWCGIADSVSHNQRLEEKEGIIILDPSNAWTRTWSVRVF